MPLDPTALLPALRPRTWLDHRGLSDDGFSDTIAHIALSRELSATVVCDGVDVSYRGLGDLDLTAHRAWDRAAGNLITRAQTAQGIRVCTRPAAVLLGPGAPGLQVAVPGAPATSWLAHPRTFAVLDEHLAGLLDEPVAWLALSTTTLVAVPHRGVGTQRWEEALSPAPLIRRDGFPVAVSARTPVPTPA